MLTDSDGNTVSIPLSAINIPTSLVKNPDGTYTFTNEAGDTIIIDATDNVINNIETILGDTNVLNELIEVLGDTYVGGNVYYDGTQFTYVDQSGATHVINMQDIVQANETVTTLVDNTDGTYTYTSENGTITNIDVPTSVVNQFEEIYNNIVNEEITVGGTTYNTFEEYLTNVANEAITIGGSTFIDVTGSGTAADPYEVSIKEGAANSMLITNAAGDVEWASLSTIVKANETVTTLVDNTDGTYTYTNENGTITNIDVPTSVVNQFEEIYNNIVNEEITVGGTTYNTFEEYLTNVANEAVTIGGSTFIDVTGSGTAADPYEVSIKEGAANSMLITNAAGDVEWANLSTIVKANETVTTLVDNTDGTYTYTSEDGTITNIDVPTSVVNQFEEIYNNIVNEEITVGGTTYNTFEEYLTNVANEAVTIGGSEFITVTGAGTAADPYVVAIEEGANNSMLITNDLGELEWATIESIVQANETVTTLVKNTDAAGKADGTYTYTSEDNTVTIIDIPSSVVENFETIVNSGPVTVNGDTFTTIEEYIEHIANSSVTIGGSDFITVTGTGTAADPYVVAIEEGANNSMLITNDLGELEWATIETIVKANETVTSMVQNNTTGVITYTPESGPATIAEVVSTDSGNEITVGADGGAFYQAVNTVRSISGSATVAAADDTVLIDASGSALTVTIPAATASNGRILILRKMDGTGNIITLSQPVTLANGVIFTQFNVQGTMRIQSDGTNWYKID